jgi:hypothetical protein
MAVLWTFREPSLGRHVRRELMRNAVLDFTPIIPVTACHQRNDVETYSRYKIGAKKGATSRPSADVGQVASSGDAYHSHFTARAMLQVARLVWL